MKSVALALIVLIASANAWPQGKLTDIDAKSERFIDDLVNSMIEDLIQAMKDAGLDPFEVEKFEYNYALSVPSVFSAAVSVDNLIIVGLSNIVVNDVTYGILSGRLTFDISLPEISGSAVKIAAGVNTIGNDLSGEGSGSLSIKEIRVEGRAAVGLSIAGITINNLELHLTVDEIASSIYVIIFGRDISEHVNTFLNFTLPEGLVTYSDKINELLAYIALIVIEHLMQ